ncbi:serine/threonine-protein kinase [Paenibacillus xanthanilyticus]|uniref:Serine/threonine protein kinase n=1 Tax=Paenibacillus xanthanilyticus TaxID=1783531 RepID=A0ABV8K399_9BACL
MSEKRDWDHRKNREEQGDMEGDAGKTSGRPDASASDAGKMSGDRGMSDRDDGQQGAGGSATDWEELRAFIERDLLPELELASVDPTEPIVVRKQPRQWVRLGAGNYAGVFTHPKLADWVVKVYAPGREGFEAETEVYRRLGEHPAFASCKLSAEAGGHRYLVLKRLRGKTLYQCMLDCTRIAPSVIADIDEALDYARSKGLYPHDVHGKNVMQHEGRGIVVDVSDFLKTEPCRMWDDLKGAYHRFYVPYLSKLPFPIPEWMMDGVRKGYRLIRGNRK